MQARQAALRWWKWQAHSGFTDPLTFNGYIRSHALTSGAVTPWRSMSTMKPGSRAAVHGVRAPVPRLLSEEQQTHEEGKKDRSGDVQAEETKNRNENVAANENDTERAAQGATAAPERPAGGEGEEADRKAERVLRHTVVSSPDPNFRQTRHVHDGEHVHPYGKQTTTRGGKMEDVEEKVKSECGAYTCDPADVEEETAVPRAPTASAASDGAEERARESLEQVRSGVPSSQASGVMTNLVRRIVYFEDPAKIPRFREEQFESFDEAMERGERQLREALEWGNPDIIPASRILRERLQGRSRQSSSSF